MGVGDDHTIFTKVGVLIGTPGFMSPEQLDPNTSGIDSRTDVYSLGVLLYFLGPEHPRTVLAMVSLAISLLEQKQYPEAEKLLTQAIEIQKRILKPNHPDTAESLYELAVLREHEGKSDQALTLLREAVDHGLPADETLRMETDPQFKSLHGDPRFEGMVAEANKNAGDATRK